MSGFFFFVLLLCFLIGVFISVQVCSFPTLDQAHSIAEIFQFFGIGIGALFTGTQLIPGMIREKQKQSLEDRYIKKYPTERMGIDFKIVHNPHVDPGHKFLLDEIEKTRHWIVNPQTMRALGFESMETQKVEKKYFDSFKLGKAIRV